jgi:hypothetical protein
MPGRLQTQRDRCLGDETVVEQLALSPPGRVVGSKDGLAGESLVSVGRSQPVAASRGGSALQFAV